MADEKRIDHYQRQPKDATAPASEDAQKQAIRELVEKLGAIVEEAHNELARERLRHRMQRGEIDVIRSEDVPE
ncbi:hypothetical protein [Micromonospora sp. NPDC049240]|uniref:hypothetical protein n=1 Tax=Micromonospora sp. NPDC049240 TaxID=3155151 RepID=UPI0033F19199